MLKQATKFAPLETAFATAAQAGFGFAEFWLDCSYLADWQTIVRIAGEFPLQYALHFPNRGDLDDGALDQAVALYQVLGCATMVIHQPMFRRYHERLLDRDPALRLAVENHHLDIGQLDRWIGEYQWLTLDVEHFWKFTLEDASLATFLGHLQELLNRIAGKLAHIHLPGYLPGYAEHRPMYCAREMVLPVLSILAAQRFEGFVVSEVDLEFQNPTELRMDTLLFDRWREVSSDLHDPG